MISDGDRGWYGPQDLQDKANTMTFGAPLVGNFIDLAGNLIGASMNANASAQANAQNIAMAREFAQNGVRWRVEDARAAGLSPLAALGMHTPSAPQVVGDHSMGNAVSRFGQNIGRSIAQTRTAEEEQLGRLNLALMQTELKGREIENMYKLALLNNATNKGPGFPGSEYEVSGQPQSGVKSNVDWNASKRNVHIRGKLGQEPGLSPSTAWTITADGKGVQPYIPQSLSESYEADPIGGWGWGLENRLMPLFTQKGGPPADFLKHWPGAVGFKYTGTSWTPVYPAERKAQQKKIQYMSTPGFR